MGKTPYLPEPKEEPPAPVKIPLEVLNKARTILSDGKLSDTELAQHGQTSTANKVYGASTLELEGQIYYDRLQFGDDTSIGTPNRLISSAHIKKPDPNILDMALESIKDKKLTASEIHDLVRESKGTATVTFNKEHTLATVNFGDALKVTAPYTMSDKKTNLTPSL